MPEKLVIVMVGLPARGKSYIAQQIVGFFQDACHNTSSSRLFNAGKERRSQAVEATEESPRSNLYRTVTRQRYHLDEPHHTYRMDEKKIDDNTDSDESDDENAEQGQSSHPPSDSISRRGSAVPMNMLFDTENAAAVYARDQIALATIQKLCIWLESQDSHQVAVFDATNTTVARRSMIHDTVRAHTSSSTPIIFIESICNDPKTIHNNILHKVTMSPDFLHNPDKEWCYREFHSRMRNYERVYEPCDVSAEFKHDPHIDQIKVVDRGASITPASFASSTSLARDCGLLELLDRVYRNPAKDLPGSLPRMLDSMSAVRSSCSSTSSSLFSIPGLLLANRVFEFENVQKIADEVTYEQEQLQNMIHNIQVQEQKQGKE
ncbi:LAME_0F09252g1_1 [Lachancea meyersii CBS 8951]|uniref:LAME_0F09252g1_1 n=1 Tax=Lachancea meyersii CBS 8951 TaxID=1266667 RepID=A0A1G4JVC5_9SACH|nr:LAME_0F09252g1_1 [Lachancea meyersii CBS 8951]